MEKALHSVVKRWEIRIVYKRNNLCLFLHSKLRHNYAANVSFTFTHKHWHLTVNVKTSRFTFFLLFSPNSWAHFLIFELKSFSIDLMSSFLKNIPSINLFSTHLSSNSLFIGIKWQFKLLLVVANLKHFLWIFVFKQFLLEWIFCFSPF